MPKLVQELNNFNVGTLTTPDIRDYPEEAASYSLNLDSVVEDGLLRGVPADVAKVTNNSDSSTAMAAYESATIKRNSTTNDVVYYNTNNTISMIKDFEGTPTTISTFEDSVSGGSQVSSSDEVCMETNNREVHIGMGSGATDKPKWCGWIDFNQFGGSAPDEPVLADAELKSGESFPDFYKVVHANNSAGAECLFGIKYQGEHLYQILISDGTITKSAQTFKSTQGLCLSKGDTTSTSDILVYDGGQGSEGTLYVVDNTTSGITDLPVKQTNPVVDSLSNILGASSTDLGNISDIISDYKDDSTTNLIYFSVFYPTSINKTADSGNCKYLYSVTKPTTTTNITLTERTPTWVGHAVSGAGASDVGKWVNYSTGDLMTPTLQTFKNALFFTDSDATSTKQVGLIVRNTTSNLTFINNNNYNGSGAGSAQTGNGSNSYAQNENFFDTDGTTVVGGTTKSLGLKLFAFLFGGQGAAGTNATGICNTFGAVSFMNADSSAVHDTAYHTGAASGDGLDVLFLGYYDGTTNVTNYATYSDVVEMGLVNHGTSNTSVNRGFVQKQMLTSTRSHGKTERGTFTNKIATGGSSTKDIYVANGLDGGRIIKSVYTISGNSPATPTAIAKSKTGITLTATANTGGSYLSTKKYFYCTSFVYDGYQESPLTEPVSIIPSATSNLDVKMDIRDVSTLSRRISHINLYKGESADITSGKPDGFFRLVKSFRLNVEWSSVTDSFWESASSNAYRSLQYTDSSPAGASYEAINGLSEVIDSTIVNYAFSTQLNGHHVVAKCFHPDLPDAERYIMKSKPGKFDQFNWTTDYLKLPNIPTAIAAFKGRIYAWDDNHTYRINLDGMYIEDIYEGVGCIGPQAFKVSEYGMCFADEFNIYLHNGVSPVAISETIKDGDSIQRPTTLDGATIATLDLSWDAKADSAGANRAAICVEFDSKRTSFLIFWSHASVSDPSRAFAWSYNLPRKRWDLLTVTTSSTSSYVRNTFQDSKGNIFYSDATNCYELFGGTTRKSWEYMTKKLSMGQHTQPVKYYNWEVLYKRGGSSKTPLVYWSVVGGTRWTHGTHSGDFAESATTQNSNTVYTHMQGKFRASNGGAVQTQEARDIIMFLCDNNTAGSRVGGTVAETEVDSLAVVFRPSRKAARSAL